MRLLIISSVYPHYLEGFYAKTPGLANLSYAEQRDTFNQDAFAWAGTWTRVLAPSGYETLEIIPNAPEIQFAWARENGLGDCKDLTQIIVAQAACFKPDILWYNSSDARTIQRIRAALSTLRLVIGWAGSALPGTDTLREFDLVLSCAAESVTALRGMGLRAEHLNHAFDPMILEHLSERQQRFDCSFVGEIVRGAEYHNLREVMLEQLAKRVPIEIFSPSSSFSWQDDVMTGLMAAGYYGVQALRKMRIPESIIRMSPLLGRAADWQSKPMSPVSHRLKPYLKPPVFGKEMFQLLRDSKITLNIHADSSPRFASNMRLFEATGVGSCLLTDEKENIHELFAPDREVITYASLDECCEKVLWLLAHQESREQIASSGMARTLKEHTFAQRAIELDTIIKRSLAP